MDKDQLHYVYVGVDLHKEHHTAVILDVWNKKLGQIQFDNKPSAFPKLLSEVEKHLEQGKSAVYGLEDTGGYGWALALYLKQQNQWVKSVNPAFANAKRKAFATVHKNDSWDAECVARVLKDDLYHLPDFVSDEHYWMMRQLVTRRRGIAQNLSGLLQQLHIQLSYVYPSYRRYFSEIDGKTALAFWETYPSPRHVETIDVDKFTLFLRKHSNNSCSTAKAKLILSCVQDDGNTNLNYSMERETIICSQVRQIRFYREELKQIEAQLKPMLQHVNCQLHTITGVDTVTAAELASEIGDIGRFGNANKLARYAGVAPIFAGSGGRGKYYKSKQGDRTLHDVFLFLAVRQIVVHKSTKEPRNPVFYEYYQRKMSEGKSKNQALICIMRRLVNIVYKMLRDRTPYEMPQLQAEN